MQKQTSIYIPKPCHEDWNKMTPTEQGKFCSGCNKQVVDFSLMSDHQILNFISHHSGKLCGRFDAEQLQRPLIEPKLKKKKSWWMALTMPLLFLFDKSGAQKIAPKQKHKTIQLINTNNTLVGDVAIIENNRVITGSVVDENNNPLPFVSIYQKGPNRETATDSIGNFSMNVNFDSSSAIIVASYIGFEAIEKQVNLQDPEVIIIMKQKSINLNDVIVTTKLGHTTGKVTLGGAIAICRRNTIVEKFDTAAHKVLRISSFKIYPNPAIRGSNIHLEIKQPGEYQMQLLDNQSRLIQTEDINIVSEKSTTQIQLPPNVAAGIYYVRLINEQTKKQYTEKLIIQ